MEYKENRFRFNNFAIDIEKHIFSYNQQVIDFPEKSFDLIAKLLQADNKTLSKNTLLDELWQDLVVSEWSLSRLVSDTRHILHKYEPKQEIIQTLRGRGFRIHPSVKVSTGELLPEIENNSLHKPSESEDSAQVGSHSFFLQKKKLMLIVAVCLCLVSVFLYVTQIQVPQQEYSNAEITPNQSVLNQSALNKGRLTVLPVQIFTDDDQDEWVEYGIMSMAIKHFQSYEDLDVTSIDTTLKTLSTIEYDRQSDNLFSQICLSLGCSQLLLFDLSLDESFQPVLSYQLQGREGQTTSRASFTGNDILESANLLLEHALQQLITQTPERKAINHTYTNNSAANMDYAIGVSKLLHGDLESAQAYFTLALKREPTFLWARIYQADLLYRLGQYDQAQREVEDITKQGIDIAQKVQLVLITSNIAYDKGDLSLSIDLAKSVIPDIVALNDKELLGSTHMNIGTSFQAMGKLDDGLTHLDKALGLYKEFGFKLREAQAIFNIGNTLWLQTSDADIALAKYEDAARIFRKLGANLYLAFTKQMSGGVKIQSKRFDVAKRDLKEAATLFKALGNEQSILYVDLDLTNIAIEELEYAEAEKMALITYQKAGDMTYVKSYASGLLVVIYLNIQQLDKAKYYLDERKKYEWYDPRPVFSMLEASYEHATGDLNKAVELANEIKVALGDDWTPGHQEFSNVFTADLAANKRSSFDYGASLPK